MIEIIEGHCVDVMNAMAPESVQAVITSPPYWALRDYGTDPVEWGDGWRGELGSEPTPQAYVDHLLEVFRAARRVLREDGTLWVNLGDAYARDGAGVPAKSMVGAPWRFALAMVDRDGWILRQDIIWHKPNPFPESCKDRCTKAHEYVFVFARRERYCWNPEALAEPTLRPGERLGLQATSVAKSRMNAARSRGDLRVGGNEADGAPPAFTADTRNRRSVWTVAVGTSREGHYATWPRALVEPMILASTRPGDTVLDPFGGSGTTALAAAALGRRGVSVELSARHADASRARSNGAQLGIGIA